MGFISEYKYFGLHLCKSFIESIKVCCLGELKCSSTGFGITILLCPIGQAFLSIVYVQEGSIRVLEE